MTYRISDVRPYDGDRNSFAKNVLLRVGDKRANAISKTVERTTDLKTLRASAHDAMNECYIDLTLDKLREIDGDTYLHESYIRARSRFLDEDNIRMFVIKLRIEQTQALDRLDYDYLLSLLSNRSNDLPIMPLLEFGDGVETPIQISTYNEFVDNVLRLRSSYPRLKEIAMSVPIYYPRRQILGLFKKFEDIGPTFVAMDLNNKRVDSVSNTKFDTIKAHFLEEKEENTFLYGINVKPYKNGGDSASALDVQSMHWSFNAIGPTHRRFVKRLIIAKDWRGAGRVYDPGTMEYTRLVGERLSGFIEWVDEGYGFRFDEDYSRNEKSSYAYLKRYNYHLANEGLAEISESLNKGETEMVDEAFDRLPMGVRGRA